MDTADRLSASRAVPPASPTDDATYARLRFPLGPRERLVLVEARGEELLIAVSPAGVFNVGATQGRTPAAQPAAAEPTFVLPDPS